MEPIDCPETSLINYHYGLRDNPEPRSSQESEKSLKKRRKRLQKVQGENKDSVERKKVCYVRNAQLRSCGCVLTPYALCCRQRPLDI